MLSFVVNTLFLGFWQVRSPPGAKTFGLTRFTVTPKDFLPAQARLVVSALQPDLRPVPRPQNCFQIQHHQDKSRANGFTDFMFIMAAILASKNCQG
jgi:hypothetical protein